MVKLAAVLCYVGGFLLTAAAGDGDFELADALDPGLPTRRPNPATKKPPIGGTRPRPQLYPDLRPYSDDHGNGGGNPRPNMYPDHKPQSGDHGKDGDFTDLDLNDGKPLPPSGGRDHIESHGGNTVDSSSTAQITSPVVAVVVLLCAGAVFGYTAYKQKRYCFKSRGGPVV
uniref:Glycoprotein Xg n=1 Tax=Pogona vitticeps TaxID=103695 RepID=A0A6J0T6H2_9SAUR